MFACERIPAGSKVWQVDGSMHIETRRSFALLEPAQITFALHGGYLHRPSGRFVWYEDGMQYLNHGRGADANVGLDYWPSLRADHIIAFRDIEAGEELREDYGLCLAGGLAPDHWLRPYYAAYCPWHIEFLLELARSAVPYAPRGADASGSGTNRRTVATSASSRMGFASTARKPAAIQAA